MLLLAGLALQISVSADRDTTCLQADDAPPSVAIQLRLGAEPKRADSVYGRARPCVRSDSARRDARRRARHIPVTPELLRTAFAGAPARALLLRARGARLAQDSALVSYDAMAYQRISAGLGFRRIGRDRLVFRSENASRVRWRRGVGAWVEMKGARTVIPMVGAMSKRDREELDADMSDALNERISPIPYYPGRDPLMPMLNEGVARASIDETEIIHPLADGAEAYYTYAIGDSVAMRLSAERTVRLVELLVRPRRPQWNLAVASLWFDVATGRLARAVYRFSEPMDVVKVAEEDDPEAFKDVPRWVKPMIMPMSANISAITVEYGLYEGRIWLPRVQSAEGEAQVSFVRVRFKMEQSFKYASVNSLDSLAPIEFARSPGADSAAMRAAMADTASDSLSRARRRATRDSIARARTAARRRECDASGSYVVTQRRADNTLPVAVRIPCDTAALAHSPDLPPSIYDSGEELFGARELGALREEALQLSAQARFAPQRPELASNLRYFRYNRVEGLSGGGALTQRLGAGYTARIAGRLGVADLQPNAELALGRSDGRRTVSIGVYRRLEASNDWGSPLGFGASTAAFLFGRDEGFYYRAWGAELAGVGEGSPLFTWRLFAEQQWSAPLKTQLSLAHAVNGLRFRENIDAERGSMVGTAFRVSATRGLDPHGWRLLSDLRSEGAAGDFTYARGALDLTLSHGLGRRLDGAVTVGGGGSAGTLPVQRLWYIGGSQSVRGQRPGAAVGDAYWLTRLELGSSIVGVRPGIFGDLGWAGRRSDWSSPGVPLSGAGMGVSLLDGLVRFDLAKGIRPAGGVRADFYVESRF